MGYPHFSIDCHEHHALVLDGNPAQVLAAVHAERGLQDAKWGEQNHPDVRPRRGLFDRQNYAVEADAWKLVNDGRVKDGTVAWDGILLEEVYEALAETDSVKLRAELIQVAAVAVSWVEAIDRRGGTAGAEGEAA